MIEIFHLDSIAGLQPPRRVMKYVLVWCSSGSLTLSIDDEDFELKAHEVITITSGQIHHFRNVNEVSGYRLEFTLDFFCKDDKDIELIFQFL